MPTVNLDSESLLNPYIGVFPASIYEGRAWESLSRTHNSNAASDLSQLCHSRRLGK